jgi:hypothetical protein
MPGLQSAALSMGCSWVAFLGTTEALVTRITDAMTIALPVTM